MAHAATQTDIEARWRDREGMEAAMNRAIRQALLRHKRLGESIAVWRDGRVVIVPPEEIEVDEEPVGAPYAQTRHARRRRGTQGERGDQEQRGRHRERGSQG